MGVSSKFYDIYHNFQVNISLFTIKFVTLNDYSNR